MARNLVIVESPAKARTIERYLGDDYRVLASYGHVRDLPDNPGKGKFGVDVDHDFTPEYVISEDRRKQVDAIAKLIASSPGRTSRRRLLRMTTSFCAAFTSTSWAVCRVPRRLERFLTARKRTNARS